jgi:hypothetical protein
LIKTSLAYINAKESKVFVSEEAEPADREDAEKRSND